MARGISVLYAACCLLVISGLSFAWQDDPDCGTAPVTDPGTNIIGGDDAQTGEYPWHAAILVNQQQIRCGATIIHPEWVITAASCIGFINYPNIYSILGGLTDLRDGSHVQLRNVTEIYFHPNYTWQDNDNDIALLRLESGLTFTDYVRAICVPQADLEGSFSPGTPCDVTGWGAIDPVGYTHPLLQEMNVVIVSNDLCQEQYPDDEITSNMICAGTPGDGKDTCNFDGGGPLMARSFNAYYLVGVISSQYCGNTSGIFTRITRYESWLTPVFEGRTPENIDLECAADQFSCLNGWCADYVTKCNGVSYDGCGSGGDERLCIGYNEYFDPFFYTKQLHPDSIVASFDQLSNDNCANLCLNGPHNQPACLAFDVISKEDPGEEFPYVCNIAGDTFTTINIPYNQYVMHFEIEKFPVPDRPDSITAPFGRLATTRFIKDQEINGILQYWVFEPGTAGVLPGMIFRFASVHHGNTGCLNRVQIRSGPSNSDPLEFNECLQDLPTTNEGVFIPGINGNYMEYTQGVNGDGLGFVAKYIAVTYCNGAFDTDNGMFTSPNYPNFYPEYSVCSTTITAASGEQVLVHFEDFILEDTPDCSADSLAVYDASTADDNSLIGVYCAETFPEYIQSTGSNLHFVFTSDDTVHHKGFTASYRFVQADDPVCGIRTTPLEPELSVADDENPDINLIGGKDAQEGEWPWTGVLKVNNAPRCGTVLIHPLWVLTTASCIDSYTFPEIFTVMMGANNLAGSQQMQELQVEEIFIHPDYFWSDSDWNIALLKMSTAFQITDQVRTVCIDDGLTITPGMTGMVTGWGETSSGGVPPRPTQYLQEIMVTTIDQQECDNRRSDEAITDRMFCAENRDTDTCFFDMGGPLVMEIQPDEYYLAGLVASADCQDGALPGVYTNVAALYDWIDPIFRDSDPNRIADCTRDQYVCPGGWCTGYETKCNGETDGCIYGGDENFCDENNEFYDPFLFNMQLTSDSIRDTFGPVSDLSNCAYLCSNQPDYLCLSFDVEIVPDGYYCHLAGRNFNAVPIPFNRSVLHFEIERTPESGTDISYSAGKISTPRFDPEYSGSDTAFSWIITPDLSGPLPGIVFRFPIVDSRDSQCDQVRLRDTSTREIRYEACLNELDRSIEGVFIPTENGVDVEFSTDDWESYGFILKFETVSYCSAVLIDGPGFFTSPNYPNNYPANFMCSTTITSPEGTRVTVFMEDFYLEWDDDEGNCLDSLTVYDSEMPDESRLVGVYCGRYVPDEFTASGQSLHFVFRSNDAFNYKGFNASYVFGEDGSVCGVPAPQPNPKINIIGGGNADVGEYPWQALLLTMVTTGTIRCGATLLTPNWAVSSALCMDTPNIPEVSTVMMGLSDLTGNSPYIQLMDVEKIYIHPKFHWSEYEYDIALMKLKTPFRINDYVRPICSPEGIDLSPGTTCTATGFGSTVPEDRLNLYLQEIEVDIISREDCQQRFPDNNVTDPMLCAHAPGKSTCRFDQGGPLVTKVDDIWYLAGVISTQFCGSNDVPGIYTNVVSVLDWIQPIYEGNEPETIPECTYEELACPEGFCAEYITKCNGINDGCRYGGEETSCAGFTEFFDPFLYTIRLNESSIRRTAEVENSNDCATLCLEMDDFICLAFDVTFSYPYYICSFGDDENEALRVPFSFANTNLQIEKFREPYTNDERDILTPIGRIASPRWIPSVNLGTVFFWQLTTDIQTEGRGYILSFPVVKSKEEDPRLCQNFVLLRLDGIEGREVGRSCLFQIPQTRSFFVPLAPYNTVALTYETEDANAYGFIAKYAAVTYCSDSIVGDPSESGTFTSPNYPDNYPPDALCTTTITAPEGYNVLITFDDFQLEIDNTVACESDYDHVRIYDSNTASDETFIGIYCGTSIPKYFQSGGRAITVEFKSDAFINYQGFSVTYEMVPVAECVNNFYMSQGSFQSPNYPSNYPNNANCPTRITAPPNYRILLVFLDVALEEDPTNDCSADFDNVKIYDSYKEETNEDRLLGALCDSNPPQTVFSSTEDHLYVVFKSDADINERGFSAIFYAYPAPSACDKVFTESPNTFSTPGYPSGYPSLVTCSTLMVAPGETVVRLNFLDFELEGPNEDDQCVFDSVTIYNGISADPDQLIGSYCGPKTPPSILSSGNTLYVEFSSDNSVNYKGFEAYFEFVPVDEAGCDNVFMGGVPGSVSSPGYPEGYPVSITCRSLIIAPDNQIVRLDILDFYLERDVLLDCASDWDWLEVYDAGEADENALIGRFCGSSINTFFESSGTRMYLVFKSDSSATFKGFNATFTFQDEPTIIPPPPPLQDNDCGKQTAPLGPITNIVGGVESEEGEWPWQGVLLIKDQSGDEDLRCGATLLTSSWVVTAAHCLDVLNDPTVYSVVMGTNSLVDLSDNIQWLDIVETYVHPDYIQGNEYDIALLRTLTPFQIDDYVRPVCTAPSNWEEYLEMEVLCTATGWGYTQSGGFASNDLREVELPIYDRQTCAENYEPEAITENMLCAGYPWGGRDTCTGDDGGPLVTQFNGQWVLAGVISWGDGCAAPNKPRVFTRITAFEDWMAPIYNGGEPDKKFPECPYDKFLCRDGWCIDYEKKCDGVVDCYYHDDEDFCEGDLQYFDSIPSKQLTADSIREQFTVPTVDVCGRVCIEDYTSDPCLAFDTVITQGRLFCYIATNPYMTQPNTHGGNHFEIENMPCAGDVIYATNGRIAAPKFTPLCDFPIPRVSASGTFWWIITPPESADYNKMTLSFGSVHDTPPSDCLSQDFINTIIVKSGPDVNDPPIGTYCLNDLPESVWIPTTKARVEFYTVEAEIYGFLASFNAFWSCDNQFYTDPGVFTSPNWPNNYPNDIVCNTLIEAPDDSMQILLFMREFSLEDQFDPTCPADWDVLRVYDGNQADPQTLIGTYCGDEVPYYFKSTGRSLYVNFKSDASANEKGFQAAYYFVPANTTVEPPGNSTDECGLQTLPLEPEETPVGGKPAQIGEYPWQAAIYYFNRFICGGAFLTPEWVVTTGACTPSSSLQRYDIIGGSNNVYGDTANAQTFKVAEIIRHPQYDFSARRYDIALIRLSTNATINDLLRTICLPSEQDQTDLPAGTMCMLSGWGAYNSGGGIGFEELQEYPLSIVDQDFCRVQHAPQPVTSEMLCASFQTDEGVCGGDGGGPLISKVDNKWYLVGMPSWQRGCADPDYPTVFTRVEYFEEWIDDVISGNYSEGGCHANFTEAPGSFQSPFYPENYPISVMCETRITAPVGYKVYLSVRDFRLEDDGSQDCSRNFDTLRVYDSDIADEEKLIGEYCGVSIPRYFTSSGRSMFIVFNSDNSVTDRGYDIGFYFISDSCHNEFTVAPGVFSSPNYPENYPSNAECKTSITAPAGQTVLLRIQDFLLEFDETCDNDFDSLTIYDDNYENPDRILGRFCGDTYVDTITSTGENMFVVFKSDNQLEFRGFQAGFYFVPERATTVPPTGPQPYCGLQTIDLDPETSIIGGSPAQSGEYPWHGALMADGRYSCGAALLTQEWAVTAAGCVFASGAGYAVSFGSTVLGGYSENSQTRTVSQVYIHPEFVPETLDFNVALLKLESPLPITDYIRTICLPDSENFDPGTACYVTGWGAQEVSGPFEENLLELLQEIRDTDDCGREYYPQPTDAHVCAGSSGRGVCTGDEGSPLVTPIEGVWYLVGVATRTSSCGSWSSVYSRMTSYYSWIAPIFEGKDPEALPPEDPLEPIREELRRVQDDTNMYMYIMYAFVGLLALLLFGTLLIKFKCDKEQKELEGRLLQHDFSDKPERTQPHGAHDNDDDNSDDDDF